MQSEDIIAWLDLTWAEQSDAVGREETVEEEAATPVPLAPSLNIQLANYSRVRRCCPPTLAMLPLAIPLQSRWSALLLQSDEPRSIPASSNLCCNTE